MTTITLALSESLTTQIYNSQVAASPVADIYAYAYIFATVPDGTTSGGLPKNKSVLVEAIELANPSTPMQSSGSYSVPYTLTEQVPGGQVYIVVNQVAHGGTPEISATTTPDEIITNAGSWDISYQLIELSLTGSQYDQGDISAVNTFGLTTTLEVTTGAGTTADPYVTQSRGFNTSADSIMSAVHSADPSKVLSFDYNALSGSGYRLASGPADTSWSTSDFEAYLLKLIENPEELAKIEIVDLAQGGVATPAHSNGVGTVLNHYHLIYQPGNAAYNPANPSATGFDEGTFYLVPDTSYGAFDPGSPQAPVGGYYGVNTNWISMTFDELVSNIFTQTTPLSVTVGARNGPKQTYPQYPVPGSDPPAKYDYSKVRGFTPNTPDGDVSKNLVAGFDAGYWGMQGTSASGTTIDLSKNYNWDVKYAYNGAMGGSVATTVPGTVATYDTWAAQFIGSTNAYGYSYTDLISGNGGVSPLIGLWDNAGGVQAQAITITVYAPDETPGSGYTAPAQTSWTTTGTTSSTLSNSSINLVMSQSVTNSSGAAVNYSLDPTMPFELTIYVDGVAYTATVVPGTAANGTYSGYYNISGDTTTGFTATHVSPPGAGGTIYVITPLAPDSGAIVQYEITVGKGTDFESSFNFFVEEDTTSGHTNGVTVLGADHGMAVAASTVTNGNNQTYNNYTLSPPTGILPFAPELLQVQGTATGGVGNTFTLGINSPLIVNAFTTGTNAPTNFADNITGSNKTNYISGLGGDDTITGGVGQDFLYGNDGDDTFVIYRRDSVYDFMLGGSGHDTLRLMATQVTLAGLDTVGQQIEQIDVAVTADDSPPLSILGTKAGEYFSLAGLTVNPYLPAGHNAGFYGIDAGGGNDLIIGSQYGDTFRGGVGGDRLLGKDGNDVLYGDKGADVLDGGTGNDLLYGGKAGDIFIFASGYEHDTIKDWTSGDRIDLSAFHLAPTWTPGDNGAVVGNDYVLTFGSDTLTILGVTSVSAGDFVI